MINSRYIVVLCLFFPAVTWACSCMSRPQPGIAAANADAVFYGTVVLGLLDEDDNQKIYQIKIEAQFKGPKRDEIEVRTGLSSAVCGYDFSIGGKYLVYAHEHDGTFSTNICTRTRPDGRLEVERLIRHSTNSMNSMNSIELEALLPKAIAAISLPSINVQEQTPVAVLYQIKKMLDEVVPDNGIEFKVQSANWLMDPRDPFLTPEERLRKVDQPLISLRMDHPTLLEALEHMMQLSDLECDASGGDIFFYLPLEYRLEDVHRSASL